MDEHKGVITIKGDPLTLVGNIPNVGEKSPDFKVIDNDLSSVKLSDFSGKVRLISSVPSIDTPVCDIQTRRFNQEAAQLGDDVEILTISMDLPFAQKRWCGAAGVDKIQTLSDHKDASFGTSYGLLIKELRLLARAIIVIDRADIITYIELVKELTKEPDYEAVLVAVDNAL